MPSLPRILFLLSAAVVETTLPALVVTIAGDNTWVLLFAVVFVGALTSRLAERYLPLPVQRLALLALALLIGLWMMKNAAGGGYSPISGWAALRAGGESAAYATLLATLYSFWRGTFLLDHDHVTLGRLFSRLVVALIIIIGIGGLASALNPAILTLATGEVIAFFVAGLLGLSVATMVEHGGKRTDWRSLATLLASIGVVVVGGVLLASLLGGTLLQLLGVLWQVAALALLLVLSPFIIALGWLAEQVGRGLDNSGLRTYLQELRQRLDLPINEATTQSDMPVWLDLALRGFCFVVPILLIAVLFLFIRRRKHVVRRRDEERESVMSWNGLVEDLGSLLSGLHRREAEGLRAALAHLQGDDPATRIRRAYIRMLLAAEARDQHRTSAQTAHEFAPAAAVALGQFQPVTTLTRAYERARYAPESVTPEQATDAENAWTTAQNAQRKL